MYKALNKIPSGLELVSGAKSPTFRAVGDIVPISGQIIDYLTVCAKDSPAKRARVCLHPASSSVVQEMVIVFLKGVFLPIEKNVAESKSYTILAGQLAIIAFEDNGSVWRVIELDSSADSARVFRLNRNVWHTVFPRSDTVVLHETASGPLFTTQESLPTWFSEVDSAKKLEKLVSLTG